MGRYKFNVSKKERGTQMTKKSQEKYDYNEEIQKFEDVIKKPIIEKAKFIILELIWGRHVLFWQY